jgi:RHS repeat-associated protein
MNQLGCFLNNNNQIHFCEDWVDQRNSTWSAPYTFSGKEKDAETGYGYFGARYYDSGLSIWLSVDPMSDKYPSMSPYNYCANNPVILVDPDGRETIVGLNGELLGCRKEGWKGVPIVMDAKDNKEGLSSKEILKNGTGTSLDKYGKGIRISKETWGTIVSNGETKIEPFLVNNSNKSVFYKPDGLDDKTKIDQNPGYDNGGAYEVKSNTDLYVSIDEVATSKFKNSVYEVQTGGKVTINRDGGVSGGVGRIFPFVGWVSGPFRSYLRYQNDSSWDNLFNAANRNFSKK